MSKLIVTSALVLVSAFSSASHAEVTSSGPDHFTIAIETEVKAPADIAWYHLLKIGTWWSSSHTWSGDAGNLTLSAKPGGGFDERLPNDGFVRHMSVIYSAPEKILRMVGVLGPLQEEALTGTMTIALTKREHTTLIKATYKVSGHFDGGLNQIAPVVDKVLHEQFRQLATVTETTAVPAKE